MASNQPHTKRDLGGDKPDSKSKGGTPAKDKPGTPSQGGGEARERTTPGAISEQ